MFVLKPKMAITVEACLLIKLQLHKDQILKQWAFWVHKLWIYGERSLYDGNHEQNKEKYMLAHLLWVAD